MCFNCIECLLYLLHFFDELPRLLFCSLLVFVQLLFEGGIYFFRKPADINDGWIRYIPVRQWRLLDAISRGNDSYNTNSPSTSTVTVIRKYTPCILAAATIRGWRLFVQSFGLCGYYLRAVTIRGWHLFEEVQYTY